MLRLDTGHRLEIKTPAKPAAASPVAPPVVGDYDTADIALGEIKDVAFRERGRNERELTLSELYGELGKPDQKPQWKRAVESQLHVRLALVALVLILPFLALPYAIGQRRGNRAYRFAVALVLLVAFHEVLQQGALISRLSGTSVWLTIWLPFALFSAFAIWRYYVTCYTLPRPWLDPFLEDIADHIKSVWRRLRPAPNPPPINRPASSCATQTVKLTQVRPPSPASSGVIPSAPRSIPGAAAAGPLPARSLRRTRL